jgi:hypothetical protein
MPTSALSTHTQSQKTLTSKPNCWVIPFLRAFAWS